MSYGRRVLSRKVSAAQHNSDSLARLDDDLHHLQLQSPFQIRQTYATLLKLCSNAGDLHQGRRVHAHIVASGLATDGFLGDHLVQMYGKCGCVDEAVSVFNALPRRTLFSWNFVIAALARNRHCRKAIEMFWSMDVKPDSSTLSSVLAACSSLRDLEQGRKIHERISSGEFQSGIAVETGLVKMYARCGRLQEARDVFDRVEKKDGICWNSMIAAYAQAGHSDQARKLYEEMEESGVKASDGTFAGILGACSSLEEGKRIHSRALARGLSSSIIVQNALVSMYARCSRLDVARAVFDKIENKTIVSWNAMIAACTRQGEPEQALELFEKINLEPNEVTFASVFNACSSLFDHRISWQVGTKIHDRIRGCHLEANVTVATSIVTMYGKLGKVGTAREVFDKIQHKNVVSWNAMLGAYVQNGRDRDALEVYNDMVSQRVERDEVTVVIALGICSSLRLLGLGTELQDLSVSRGFDSNIKIQNALINMYGKCGKLDSARQVFSKVAAHDVVSWTALIVAYTQQGRNRDALELYKEMEREGIEPDTVTYTSVLSACSNANDLELGQALHARFEARKTHSIDDTVLASLINMYVKCRRLDLSSEIFRSIKVAKTLTVWNAMITAYQQEGFSRAALDLYDEMKQQQQQPGLDPDESTFSSALSACAELKDLEKGEEIYTEITASSSDCYKSVVVLNALINMYVSCGDLRQAKSVFKTMENRDVVSWTILISAFVQSARPRRALGLYRRMILDGIHPTEVTMLAVIAACSAMENLFEGVLIHALTDSKFFSDMSVQAALVLMYARCRRLDLSCQVFKQVRHLESSANCWNAMLGAYTQLGFPDEAIQLYKEMTLAGIKANEGTFAGALAACSVIGALREGYKIHEHVSSSRYNSDLGLKTALVNFYAKCGQVDAAVHIFDLLQEPDAIAWNAMIAAYAQNSCPWHAIELYRKMISESNVLPDNYTITNILSVCSNLRLLDEGKKIYKAALKHSPELERDTAVECAMFNLYAKCGKLAIATAMFEEMETKNVVCWHGIIAAYAHHGYGTETLWYSRLFELDGFKPMEPTFLCLFLACGHTGLVDECRWYFQSMVENGIGPTFEHYACVANVLSRAGKLAEAEDLLQCMPFWPGSVGWTSLLGACRTHGDLKRARRAAEEAAELDREESAPYVLLSNASILS